MEDNIERYLKPKNLPSAHIHDIKTDIFVDLCSAVDNETFENMLCDLKVKWEKIDPGLINWFTKYQSEHFKLAMT